MSTPWARLNTASVFNSSDGMSVAVSVSDLRKVLHFSSKAFQACAVDIELRQAYAALTEEVTAYMEIKK